MGRPESLASSAMRICSAEAERDTESKRAEATRLPPCHISADQERSWPDMSLAKQAEATRSEIKKANYKELTKKQKLRPTRRTRSGNIMQQQVIAGIRKVRQIERSRRSKSQDAEIIRHERN